MDNVEESVTGMILREKGGGKLLGDFIIPSEPDHWNAPMAKTDRGEPDFEDLENPGGWSQFVFRPTFDADKKQGERL